MKKFLVMFLVVCALAFVYGCGGGDEPTQPAATTNDAPATTAPAAAEPAPAATEDAAVEEATDAATEAEEAAEDTAADQVAVDPADPFANQGPISQADVDAYIKAIPQITASAGDEAKLMAIYKEAGWDEWRGAYVISKVGTAYAISMAPAQADMMTAQLPASLKPTQAEIDMVAKAQDKITKALMGQ